MTTTKGSSLVFMLMSAADRTGTLSTQHGGQLTHPGSTCWRLVFQLLISNVRCYWQCGDGTTGARRFLDVFLDWKSRVKLKVQRMRTTEVPRNFQSRGYFRPDFGLSDHRVLLSACLKPHLSQIMASKTHCCAIKHIMCVYLGWQLELCISFVAVHSVGESGAWQAQLGA